MEKTVQYEHCQEFVLNEYNNIKDNLGEDEKIVCQHIGTFKQDILISIISLLDHALVENCEPKGLSKRLSYITIESIQNIIQHSDNFPDDAQLAYLLIIKNNDGYQLKSSNTILNNQVDKFSSKMDALLKEKISHLKALFEKKMKSGKINKNGRAGIGLLTMVSKTGKEFNYDIIEITNDMSVLNFDLNLKYKNYP